MSLSVAAWLDCGDQVCISAKAECGCVVAVQMSDSNSDSVGHCSFALLPLPVSSQIVNSPALSPNDLASSRLACWGIQNVVDHTLERWTVVRAEVDQIAQLLGKFPAVRKLELADGRGLFASCKNFGELAAHVAPLVQQLSTHTSLQQLTLSSKHLQQLGARLWAHQLVREAAAQPHSTPRQCKYSRGYVIDDCHQVYWLPDWLASPPGLKQLVIKAPSSSSSSLIPACLWMNPQAWTNKLTCLEINGLPLLHQLPPAIPALRQLHALSLVDCRLQPRALSQLVRQMSAVQGLQVLVLADNDILQLPKEGWEGLAGLKVLDLSRNHLVELSPGLAHLTGLTALHLQNNQLATLPPHLSAHCQLALLDASHNWLSGLKNSPAWGQLVSSLSALRVLRLANVSDKRGQLLLPQELAGCGHLCELVLGHNHDLDWQSLEVLGRCKALQLLNLSGMSQAAVPPSISQLLSGLQHTLKVQWG